MNDSEGSSKKIKVVDRRRFTDDGSPREVGAERTVQEPTPAAPTVGPSVPGDPPEPDQSAPTSVGAAFPEKPNPTTSQDFVELIATLAQQAEMVLVGAEDLPAQPEQAKRLIDYLGALEIKTRGNLSTEEQRLLSTVVFELQTMFVQASQ